MNLGALVLCGGRSRRIGTNKAYLLDNNKPFINIIVGKLQLIFKEVIVAVDEMKKYTQIAENGVVIVEDEITHKGPIEGLRKGLQIAQSDYLFVCACDMPKINIQCINELSKYIEEGVDCVLPLLSKVQILHGFYNKQLYRKITSKNYFSIKELLKDISVKYVADFDCNIKESTININTLSDYESFIGGVNG